MNEKVPQLGIGMDTLGEQVKERMKAPRLTGGKSKEGGGEMEGHDIVFSLSITTFFVSQS